MEALKSQDGFPDECPLASAMADVNRAISSKRWVENDGDVALEKKWTSQWEEGGW